MFSVPVAKFLLLDFIDECIIMYGRDCPPEEWIKQTMTEFLEMDIDCRLNEQDNEEPIKTFFKKKTDELSNLPAPVGFLNYRSGVDL